MVGKILKYLAKALALSGGMIVLALIAMSLISLVGRKLFSTPISGDIEMLEMAIAVAVTAFFPLCELNGNHIRVDFLAGFFPDIVNRILLCIGHGLLAGVGVLLIWRTILLVSSSLNYESSSTMLAVPLWIPQAMLVPSLVLLVLCALYRAGRSLVESEKVLADVDGAMQEVQS